MGRKLESDFKVKETGSDEVCVRLEPVAVDTAAADMQVVDKVEVVWEMETETGFSETKVAFSETEVTISKAYGLDDKSTGALWCSAFGEKSSGGLLAAALGTEGRRAAFANIGFRRTI